MLALPFFYVPVPLPLKNSVLSEMMRQLGNVTSRSKIDWYAIARISRLKRSPQELERRWAELLGVIPSSNLMILSNRERGMLAGITLKMGLDLRDADLSRLQSMERGNNVECSRRRTVGVKRPLHTTTSKSEHSEESISYDSMTDSQGEEDKEAIVNNNYSSSVCDDRDTKRTIPHPPLTSVAAPSSSSRAVSLDLQNVLHNGVTEKSDDTFSGFSILQRIGMANSNSGQFSIGLSSLLNCGSSTIAPVAEHQQQQATTGETQGSKKVLRIFEGIEKLQMNKK